MDFDLQRGERLGRRACRFVEHGDVEIRHPDIFREPGLFDLAQRADRLRQRNLRVGPVDQQQIDPRQTEPLQAFIDRALEIARRQAVEPDFGGDEDLFALDAGGAQAVAHLALVAIHLRGVEMPVAQMQRRLDHFDAQILFERHGPEPE